MKKLILAAAPVALFAAAPAFAGQAVLNGQVPSICEVNVVDSDLYLGTNIAAGATIGTPIGVTCNDADGATMTMTSTEGGLESDDFEDLEVEYEATLSVSGNSVTLDTGANGQGNNDESVTLSLPANPGPQAGSLSVVLIDNAPWAGGYSDTIQLDITAN